jgi:hypothetical protein
MEERITVVSVDSKRFLEKVMRFGIDHELISQERRETFVRAGGKLYSQLCARLLGNEYDIGDAVRAGEKVLDYISIALERESGGDMVRASAYFSATSDVDLTQSIIGLIEDASERIGRLFHNIRMPVHVKFDYYVNIWKINNEYPILRNRINAVRHDRWLADVYDSIKDARQLEELLKSAEEMGYEFYVSSTFLPWSLLKEHAGLKSINATPEGQNAVDGMPIQFRTFQGDWDNEMLLATMTVLWVCGGSYCQVGTVVPRSVLDHIKKTLKSTERFKARAREKFEKHLEDIEIENKSFDEKAKACLTQMWERAMTKLLFGVPEQLSKFNLMTWFYRLITDIEGNVLQGHSLHAFEKNPRKFRISSKRHALLDKLKDPEKELTPGRAKGILRYVRWHLIDKSELREVIKLLSPAILTDYVAVTIDTVDAVTEQWGAWTIEEKRKFIDRVINADSAGAKFWEHLEETVFDRLSSVADSLQKSSLLHERRKHFLVQ